MKAPPVIWFLWFCLFLSPAITLASAELSAEGNAASLPPTVEAIISGDLCEDGMVTVTLTGADNYLWVDNNSTENPRSFDLAAGVYSFDVTGFDTSDGSSSTITVDFEIIASPTPIILPTDGLICEGNSLTLTALVDAGSSWEWSTGDVDTPTISVSPDTSTFYSLTETTNGCSATFQVMVSVQHPIAAPDIFCGEVSTDSIQFIWNSIPGATGYQIDVLSGHSGTQVDDTTFIVNNLNPEETVEIEVTSMGTLCGGQTTSFSCTSDGCFLLDIDIDPVDDICLDPDHQEINLMVSTNDPTGIGTGFWSGQGITNSTTGTFDPVDAGTGIHELFYHYEIGQCNYSDSIEVNIFNIPESEFSLSQDTICLDGSVTASFTSVIEPDYIFNWNFDSGTSDSGTDLAGPHEVNWSLTGDYEISLQVNTDHCSSTSDTLMVHVVPPLGTPVINCESATTSSVTFSWDPVPNAVDYSVIDLNGPTGSLNGTTYTVSGLPPEQTVDIELTALSNGYCSNTMAVGSCETDICPEVTVEVTGPDTVCLDDPVAFELLVVGSTDMFEITYQLENNAPETINTSGSIMLPGFQIQETSTLTVQSYSNLNSPECQYNLTSTWTIEVNEPLSAGTPLDTIRFCANNPQTIILADLLSAEDTGGNWSETSPVPSEGGAFDAATGTFNTDNQTAGTYDFTYSLESPAPCPGDAATVVVVINPVPVADAGQDQQIACDQDQVTLDGGGSTTGNGMVLSWIAPPGVTLDDASNTTQIVNEPGIYTLEVTNIFGCLDTDNVVVTSVLDLPEASWSVEGISCFDANDGIISVENITGGTPPYNLTFEGEVFDQPITFSELEPGTYPLTISDANFCETQYFIELEEPGEIEVNLVSFPNASNALEYGDTVLITVQYTADFPIDTIIWRPETLNTNGQTSISVTPLFSTPYSVMVMDENGCIGEADLTIFVEKSRPVYIPNAFSPNNDGINDFFYIQGTDGVTLIKSLSVFDRWGNHIYSNKAIMPNDINAGWDGKYKGQNLPPGVYTFFAEIEFKSGETEMYSGSLTLVR